jgi:Tfp pilus assembly protein PilV
MSRQLSQGFSLVEALLVVVLLAAVGFVGFRVYQANVDVSATQEDAATQSDPLAKSTVPAVTTSADLDKATNALDTTASDLDEQSTKLDSQLSF